MKTLSCCPVILVYNNLDVALNCSQQIFLQYSKMEKRKDNS